MDQVTEAAQDVGAFASEVVGAIKERPYATMAVAGGLAFAIGAMAPFARYSMCPNLDPQLIEQQDRCAPVKQLSFSTRASQFIAAWGHKADIARHTLSFFMLGSDQPR